MNWDKFYRSYRGAALVFHLAIFVMVFVAIFPVAEKGISVENVGNPIWKFDGEYVNIQIPVKIKNQGVYNINNLTTYIDVKNASATFVESKNSLGDIPHGTIKIVWVTIPVNLTRIYKLESPTFYHFYHYDSFNVTFVLSLKYMINLITMLTVYKNTLHWQPIIREFVTHHPNYICRNKSSVDIIVPYTIETASYLYGDATFSGKVTGNSYIGLFNTKFPLGKKYNGKINMTFAPSASKSLITHSQKLKVDGNISFSKINVPLKTTYYWGAPLNNLKINVLKNGTLHYSFQDDADFGMHLHIKKEYYYKNETVYSSEETLTVSSGETVNRYEAIGIQQPIDKVIVTIYDNNTGVYYQKVINL